MLPAEAVQLEMAMETAEAAAQKARTAEAVELEAPAAAAVAEEAAATTKVEAADAATWHRLLLAKKLKKIAETT